MFKAGSGVVAKPDLIEQGGGDGHGCFGQSDGTKQPHGIAGASTGQATHDNFSSFNHPPRFTSLSGFCISGIPNKSK